MLLCGDLPPQRQQYHRHPRCQPHPHRRRRKNSVSPILIMFLSFVLLSISHRNYGVSGYSEYVVTARGCASHSLEVDSRLMLNKKAVFSNEREIIVRLCGRRVEDLSLTSFAPGQELTVESSSSAGGRCFEIKTLGVGSTFKRGRCGAKQRSSKALPTREPD